MNERICSDLSQLFSVAQDLFASFIEELRSYNLEIDSSLKLLRGSGMLSYYNIDEMKIYLSIPDPSEPVGKIKALYFCSLLGLENNEELAVLISFYLPWLIAHELGHYLRHHYGFFSDDLWKEEQIANQLANAMSKHRYQPHEKELVIRNLEKIMKKLSEKMESEDIVIDTYHSFLDVLNISGLLGDEAVSKIGMMGKIFSIRPEDMIKASGSLPFDMLKRIEHREDVIQEFNEEYTSNIVKYMFFQFGWMLLDLKSREYQYVQEFIHCHLNRRVALLSTIPSDKVPSEEEIIAMYQAYVNVKDLSKTAGYYFYKRYRSLLIAKLEETLTQSPVKKDILKKEAKGLLENWYENELETLDYAMLIATKNLLSLFPNHIHQKTGKPLNVEKALPSETDIRLYRHIIFGEFDEITNQTLLRLELLHNADIFRSLPAEILIELTHSLFLVKVREGETIIWKGSQHDDVFILIDGELEVTVGTQEKSNKIFIEKGEIFGEVAFLTLEARSATVRAVKASECYVLKSSDLRLFVLKHPFVLMQIARVLAQRLIARENQ